MKNGRIKKNARKVEAATFGRIPSFVASDLADDSIIPSLVDDASTVSWPNYIITLSTNTTPSMRI